MPLNSYGVLTGRAVDRRREGAPYDTPHYQIHLVDGQGGHLRIAVNVRSQLRPSELLYLAVDALRAGPSARRGAALACPDLARQRPASLPR